MSEPIDWLPGGIPYSPRFGDRYHSESGIQQAQDSFLHGCGLPAAWRGRPQWRILETGFGFGLNFLVTWAAWRADPERPTLLHFVSCEAWPVSAADLLRAAQRHPALLPLATQLHDQFWGLLPGVHRLAFEGGRVLLTLCVGDAQALLRQQTLVADAVYLDGFSPQRNPELWDIHTLKAVARCCRRGTRLATWSVARTVRDALAQCGFSVQKVPGAPPKRDNLQATFDPRWEPRPARQAPDAGAQAPQPSRCIVIGGGLAGAAAAASLARRGWQVRVLDRAAAPAAGASGLPAGLFAPHVSPDDSVLSRLSRSGVRATLQALQALPDLQAGEDWGLSGVLERRLDGTPGLPPGWADGPGGDWSQPAAPHTLQQAGLPPEATACWHARAGWVRPARLVAALLAHPAIAWHGSAEVARLRRTGDAPDGGWKAIDAQGRAIAQAPWAIVAAGPGSMPLLDDRWPLQFLRGQVSWGEEPADTPGWPPFPVNGHGSLVPHVPIGGARTWHAGATFERGQDRLPLDAHEQARAHAANQDKLRTLLPAVAEHLAPAFAPAGAVRAFAAVRCAAPDRLPLVGPVDAQALPGLWACTAMGARGLTLALLCGELLAARLHGEPLPLDAKLARALDSQRANAFHISK